MEFSTLRWKGICIALIGFFLSVYAFTFGFHYFTLSDCSAAPSRLVMESPTESAGPGRIKQPLSDSSDIDNTIDFSTDAESIMCSIKTIQLSMHNSAANKHQKSAVDLNGAVRRLYQIQPTHYQSLPLALRINLFFQLPLSSSIDVLRTRLSLGLNEAETQTVAGPFVIEHWQALPQDIRQLSLPMIQSGLRQSPTRQILLNAMMESGNIEPFLSLSPNRKTSEALQTMLTEHIKNMERSQ